MIRHVATVAGFLSTLSSESSVLILMLITSDRLVSVTRPFDRRQTSLRRATLLVAVLWLLAAVVAALPLCAETVDYFGEEFYGGNGVCLPLHLQKPFADVSKRIQSVCVGPCPNLRGKSDRRSGIIVQVVPFISSLKTATPTKEVPEDADIPCDKDSIIRGKTKGTPCIKSSGQRLVTDFVLRKTAFDDSADHVGLAADKLTFDISFRDKPVSL